MFHPAGIKCSILPFILAQCSFIPTSDRLNMLVLIVILSRVLGERWDNTTMRSDDDDDDDTDDAVSVIVII